MRARAVAGAALVALATSFAQAHEPYQITTDARALPGALTLHVTLASRTAALACPGVVTPPRSLRASDLVVSRTALEACVKELYVVTSVARVLAPNDVTLALTEEGDLDAWVRYPPAAPGPLVFDAVHLTRLRDPLFGAELTVTGDGVFLGQAVLRAAAPSFRVEVPPSRTLPPLVTDTRPSSAASRATLLEYFVLALLVLGATFLAVRRFR